jgi:heme A synthase
MVHGKMHKPGSDGGLKNVDRCSEQGRVASMGFSESFFEVAAQLIPVLFLALVVEEKLQPDTEETAGDRVTRSWLLVLLVVGELISLSVVAGGLRPSKGVGAMVAGAMLLAAFLLTLPVLTRELKDDRSPLERLGHASAGVAVLVAVLGTLVAIQLS